MNPPRVYVIFVSNFKVWYENVKYKLLFYGSNICKSVCAGCGKDPLAPKVLKKDVQARCIIYRNIHNKIWIS